MSDADKKDSKPTPAQQGAALADKHSKAAGEAISGTADKAKAAVSDSESDKKETPEAGDDSGTGIGGFFGDLWKKIKEFIGSSKENGSIGSILGGLLGLGGAWFAGNFFGGGIMSTILMIALAIPLMLAGSDSIGGWINGLLGQSDSKHAGDSPERSVQRSAAAAKDASTATSVAQTNAQAASFIPTKKFTNDELWAMVNPTDGQPDNNKLNRLQIVVSPNDPTRTVQVRSVADYEPHEKGMTTLEDVLKKVGPQASGIVFGQAVDGIASVQAAPMGALANSSTGRSIA